MITPGQYKKLNNTGEFAKAEARLVVRCHLFIRLRDLQLLPTGAIVGKCISCGKKIEINLYNDRSIANGRDYHAGHYFKSDRFASVRFDERNINGQCKQCNRQLHGNESAYEINLRKKIGDEEFEKLIIKRNTPHRFNIIEIEELTEYYKPKAKAEAERLRIKI